MRQLSARLSSEPANETSVPCHHGRELVTALAMKVTDTRSHRRQLGANSLLRAACAGPFNSAEVDEESPFLGAEALLFVMLGFC